MNKERRKRLEKVLGTLQELQAEIEAVKDEEQEAFDNMPESLQQGDRGQTMEEGISHIEDAQNGVEEAIAALENLGE